MRGRTFTSCLFGLAALLFLSGADELSPEQRERLATAHDGGDHREEAFFALVENFRVWLSGGGASPTEPVRLHFDPPAMIADPERFRGELCLVLGRLEQRAPLAPPYDVGEEWFIRDRSGEPVIVYVVEDDGDGFREGRQVRVLTRFYKRIDAVARDGTERGYAAFVGARPQIIRVSGEPEPQSLVIVLVPVIVLLGAFLVLIVYVRRQRNAIQPSRRRADHAGASVDDGGPLPDDPAEALAELKRRADAAEQ